ncbi:MAG: hypothetical protein ACYC27_05515 [Armatimonadota bacterium]
MSDPLRYSFHARTPSVLYINHRPYTPRAVKNGKPGSESIEVMIVTLLAHGRRFINPTPAMTCNIESIVVNIIMPNT